VIRREACHYQHSLNLFSHSTHSWTSPPFASLRVLANKHRECSDRVLSAPTFTHSAFPRFSDFCPPSEEIVMHTGSPCMYSRTINPNLPAMSATQSSSSHITGRITTRCGKRLAEEDPFSTARQSCPFGHVMTVSSFCIPLSSRLQLRGVSWRPGHS
jgi:hypothetical protein